MDRAAVAAVRDGDGRAFDALAEQYRRQLHVHCYRMLGSVDDADDVVQETFLNAWRARASFEGRSTFRTWLYRIATNACLRALKRAPRRAMPQYVVDPVTTDSDWSNPPSEPPPGPEIPWLQPYPDSLLDPVAPHEAEPEEVVVSRETIELAYLTALQRLPPRQRAVLVLRHTLGWGAKDTASALDMSVASVNSALQRARATMRRHLPRERQEWTADASPPRRVGAVAWELAFDGGDLVGLVMPTVAPSFGTIGYVGVVPEQRGHGYVNDLLARGTRTLLGTGASVLRADADLDNAPMAAAFIRAGWQSIGTRNEFELRLQSSRAARASR